MLKQFAIVITALLVLQSTAYAALYKWVDEKGNVNYSNQPPPLAAPVAPAAPADTSKPRSFPLPLHGNLVLNVPESWDHEIQQPPGNLPPTIILSPRQGDDFKVLITAMWSFKEEAGSISPETTKRVISDNRTRLLPTAIEQEVAIQEFRGKDGPGYYFLVTDKAPGTSYPYLVSVGNTTGDLLLITTILSRTKDSEAVRQTLKALQGAVQIKG